jgi:L-histidine Nalpha-methyltransferase
MRPFAASKTTAPDATRFAEDVAYYLTQAPRQLPSRYIYDALGSALFDAICELPWYRITRAEQRLLSAHGRDIFARVAPSAIVELGPGRGAKLATLLQAVPAGRRPDVHLVDVSSSALEQASETIGHRFALDVITHRDSYESGLSAAAALIPPDARTLTLLLGSNIGNFDPPSADALLRAIRAALASDDALVVGADLVKPERELLLAYDDPLGVTAAFNRNLLVRINRELGGDFDVDAFGHRAIWNADASRVEMHLVSARAQRVRVAAAHLDVTFGAGETIWTESSYKYEPDALIAMLARAGFGPLDQWIDAEDRFALTLVEAV